MIGYCLSDFIDCCDGSGCWFTPEMISDFKKNYEVYKYFFLVLLQKCDDPILYDQISICWDWLKCYGR